MSAFIDGHRARFGVEPICRVLGVSASAYFHRVAGRRSRRVVEDERLLELIEEVAERNYGAYGYRKTWLALRRAGHEVGRDRVKRLMRRAGIQGAKRRGKPWRTTTPDPAASRPPDLVDRDFAATRPDKLWVADFTYLRCWEGVVFFSFVLDAYSRRVVGWQFSPSMRTDLVLDALRMALTRREHGADLELVHHSDAGSQSTQYTSFAFQQELDDHRVLQSIGSVGDAYDNAMAESFVDTFKTELIADRVWRTRGQLELAIVEWVAWFNTERLHQSLGDIPPAEIEALYAPRNEPSTPSRQREETNKPGLRGTQPASEARTPSQTADRPPAPAGPRSRSRLGRGTSMARRERAPERGRPEASPRSEPHPVGARR